MIPIPKSLAGKRGRVLRDILIYGVCGGVLVAVLRLMQYRFLIEEHSVELYAGLVAALFAAVGIWLGLTLNKRKRLTAGPMPGGSTVGGEGATFVANEAKLKQLGITPREVEILELIASGLSNREIADRLFVSENTVKTHSSRLFEKLGAKRRTQAVQLGKAEGLIP